MAYTPNFQKILDQCDEVARDQGREAARQYFQDSVANLEPYERLNNLYRVRPKRQVPGAKDRLVPFICNDVQAHFFHNHTNRDLVLKSRQQGFTTFSLLIALDMCLWQKNVHTAVMAHVRENLKIFFETVKVAFRCFQEDWGELYPVSTKFDNKTELKIRETDSSLVVCTETKGIALDFLHVSEAAFVDDSRISESVESVPLSGWVILESTADTSSGMFYEIFDRADLGKSNTYKVHFYEWWWTYPEKEDKHLIKVPPHFTFTPEEAELVANTEKLTPKHIVWRRGKIDESGNDVGEFLRKYPEDPRSCFLYGSSSIFPVSIRLALEKNMKQPAFIGILEMNTRAGHSKYATM